MPTANIRMIFLLLGLVRRIMLFASFGRLKVIAPPIAFRWLNDQMWIAVRLMLSLNPLHVRHMQIFKHTYVRVCTFICDSVCVQGEGK